jgi:hypothetical protein
MPIIRKKLDENAVYPTNLRYNQATDTVQSLINGVWTDNPEADPRNQTTFPPRITADPACDAAQSVTDAIHGQIDEILVAIDNAATLFTIAGIILSIFTFGAYALFVTLALGIGDQMVGFGSTAIQAALTEPVYETLRCILNCHMNNQGRVKPGEFNQILADVTAQIGGIGATILNAMLSLAGEGGVNNLAGLGTATGDCDLCDCGIACGDPLQVTIGTVLEEYIENGRKVLRVQSAAFSTFQDVSLGVYGQPAGDYPCCHIFAWVHYFGGAINNTAYTTCTGTVFDPGNPETHEVSHAAWNTVPGDNTPFIINIVFGV